MQDPSNDNQIKLINVFVGSRIREARKRLNLSQGYIGYYLKVSYQQIQKFEKGINNVNSAQLAILARVLGVSILYFFEGMPPAYLQNLSNAHPDLPPIPEDILIKDETQELISSYFAVKDDQQRQSLLNMLKAFANRTFGDATHYAR